LLGTSYIQIKENNDEIVLDITRHLLPSDIQHSSTTSVKVRELERNNFYIHRPDLEKKFTSILHRGKAIDKYFVVYGPKGVGKSVLISKCVDGKKGVMKVIISSVFQKSDILKVLSTKLLGEGSPAITEKKMVDVFYKCKQFAVCSNCIIILSETSAVLVFGQDRAREEIILVPELTQG
jgi:hypothetical protein